MPSIATTKSQSQAKGRCLALFPGAFRPPHEAHLAAVQALAARADVNEVVVIISNRCRHIPGTSKALDAEVASRVWSIYLQDVAKTRLEIAQHDAISHALGYFERVATGDTLLFSLGEADFARGDDRFAVLPALIERTGVAAQVVPAPTALLSVRATMLRQALAVGDAGRNDFMAALPGNLRREERAHIWSICHDGMREMSEIVAEKIERLLAQQGINTIEKIHCLNPGKADPVLRVQLLGGRSLVVKYAGDTVEEGSLGQHLRLKPRRRLAAERRAIMRLRTLPLSQLTLGEVKIPEVILFDKETQTLALSEVCPGGRRLEDDLRQGIFDVRVARSASRFLAACHQISAPVAPVWGESALDQQHWQAMLALRTVAIPTDKLSAEVQAMLAQLRQASDLASENRFFHLDLCPKNILVDRQRIGVIDFELSSSIGDPAYDLGLLLGHYLLWGVGTGSAAACQAALHEALAVYQQTIGERWPAMCWRVIAFAGATLLYNLLSENPTEFVGRHLPLWHTANTLLVQGNRQVADPDSIHNLLFGSNY